MKTKLLPLFLLCAALLGGLTASAAPWGEDPYLSYQTNLDQIGWSTAWNAGFDGSGATVALIDSGVYTRHEDLYGANLLPSVDFVPSYGPFGYEEDSVGHGTFIAGMLSAVRGNGVGIAGMVDGAALRSFKCYSASDETDAQYVIDAIYSAVDDYGCDVINLSAGVNEDVPALRTAIDHAVDAGVIVVAAVGNDGTGALSWPAAYDSVVGVGSVDGRDNVSYFSQHNSSVFVVAPGEEIVSLGTSSPRSYVGGDGTSYACVHVTALAAVAKQYDASIDAYRFLDLLKGSARDLGPAGYDTYYGWGIVDVPAFIQAMYGEDPAAEEPPAPEESPVPEEPPEPEASPAPEEPPAEELPPETWPATPYDGRFTDIAGHWAEAYIVAAVERGIFSGMTDTEFWPDYDISRAMAAELLYRLAGEPAFTDPGWRFGDVAADVWYTDAVAWATQTGVFTGDADGLFHPERDLTRQEFAAILYRFARWQGRDLSVTAPPAFTDAAELADWAAEAAAWCGEKGYITGRPDGRFDPRAGATRAETAAILVRYMNFV